jgi:glutathione synthase/RimK-type ligase-like ATP-grasp enzyme
MKQIAFLTSSNVMHPDPAHLDAFREYKIELDVLQEASLSVGFNMTPCIWDAPEFDPAVFDVVMVGTCWDYMEKTDAFLHALDRCDRESRLLNPVKTMRWNSRKTYMRDLAAKSAPIIPTVWADQADEPTILGAFDVLGADDIVVKPIVGGGAWRQARIRRGEAVPHADLLPPDDCMIQPFLPSVSEEGEYTFLFFDRQFSHCALKRPAAGDYRVQSEYGGSEVAHSPTAEELALASSVVDCIEGDLLYARVDMLRGLDGKLALIEIELIEPYLYPEQGPNMGAGFAAALKRLAG